MDTFEKKVGNQCERVTESVLQNSLLKGAQEKEIIVKIAKKGNGEGDHGFDRLLRGVDCDKVPG